MPLGRSAAFPYGRINAFKMNQLPNLLYLFQALLVLVPETYFAKLKISLLKFLWGRGCHRIAYKTLCAPKEHRGLALPEIQDYFGVAQLRMVMEWSVRDSHGCMWLDMDRVIAGHTI